MITTTLEDNSVLSLALKAKGLEAKKKNENNEKSRTEKAAASDMYAGIDDHAEDGKSDDELDMNGESKVQDKLGNKFSNFWKPRFIIRKF